ncbi:hypothetical protein F7734_28655 [Scytonema sp. UIC 10036]|uniref:malectin domain-containing carbohydrate-binding protein n=1 Tax=Scytonema sp. UIC 10036 TaxID=2304196 RepID=UPI0012DAD284|nr:malectin domain-containing carbohydrate-binding protein [Scytonema sp. UIC 10036]MUG96098.1 hypothetical protein [Scytonema sp. UIC 10036]
MVSKALFTIDPSSSGINTSTYTASSFKITNNSTTGEKINRVLIDLSSSILPDLVFDPYGTVGDSTAKVFTVDSEGGTGYVTYNYLKAHDNGFDALEIIFNEFAPGKTFTFSIDVDPTSIKGSPAPGPNESGSVSGLELLGTTVTVDFSDNTSYTGQTYRIPNSADGSQVTIQPDIPLKPTIEVLGLPSTPSTVLEANQTVRVYGSQGATVNLLLMEAGLFTNNGSGFDLDPFEANSAISVNEKVGTIGTAGYVDIPITLTRSHADGGLNHIVAVIKAPDGTTSLPSTVQVVQLAPSPSVIVQPTGGNTSVAEGGATDTYSLALNTQPTANVTVNLAVGNQLFADKTSVTFTPSNWNTHQTITLSAIDDSVVEGAQTANITHTVSSADSNYNNLSVSNVSVTIADNDNPEATPGAIRINAGGQDYIDTTGNLWSADQYFSGGSTKTYASAIANTVEDPLYQNERTGKTINYAIPVANGEYTVNLKLAELYWGSALKRIFDVSAENQLVFDNLDIFAESGAKNKALDKSFKTIVTDGVLNLNMVASVDNATIDAIEIIPVGTPTPSVILQLTNGNTSVTEGGATDTYSLALSTQPTENVTINLAVGNQLSADKTSVTFTPNNWNIAQTITLSAVDDTVIEAAQTVSITHNVTSTDSNYNNISVPNVTVSVTDNDRPEPTPGTIRINTGGQEYTDTTGNLWSADQYFSGGSTKTYGSAIANTVEDPLYQSERTGKTLNYAIPVANGEYTVNLKLAELYWGSALKRIFDVSAENQLVFDNLDIFAESGAKNKALDKSFKTIVTDGVLNLSMVASVDNAKIDAIEIIPVGTPTPSVILQLTNGNTSVTEGGSADTYSLALSTQPTENVTINLALGNQLSADQTSVTFTPSNWNIAQTITLSAVDDTVVEGAQTANITHTVSSADSNYNNISIPNVSVTIADNDNSQATPGAIRINAGGQEYTDTTGNLWSADQYFSGGSTKTYASAIANTVEDPLYQNERTGKTINYAIPVANGEYTVNLKLAELYWGSALKRIFDVSAENQLVFDNLDIFAESGAKNKALDKSFKTIVTDGVLNLNMVASVDNATIDAIEIIPVGTPTPSVILQLTNGNTSVTEGGATDTYSLALSTQPTENVTINLAVGNQLSADKTSVTFTPNNWNIAQTITLTAVDDTVIEGAQTVSITHNVTSTDSNYNNISVPNVTVSVTDNDNPAATPGTIRIDVGAQQAYTDLAGNVWSPDRDFLNGTIFTTGAAIAKTDDDPLYQTQRTAKNLAYEIPVANGNYLVNLHFAESYWNDYGQRIFDISLEGEQVYDDLDIFGQSKNAFFPGKNSALALSFPEITVTDGKLNVNFAASFDNAALAALEVIPLTGPRMILHQTARSTEAMEGGYSDTYSIVLNTKPTANVTINLTPDSQISTDKTSVTFTPGNWNVAQTIAVNAIDDTLEEGTQTVNIAHTITSADSDYSSLSVSNLAVKVIDDELPPIDFTKKKVATIGDPTTGAWGPDGRLYVGTYSGEIRAYTFDENYNVIGTQIITTLMNLPNSDILGIAFNPFDSTPKIYVSHSKLYGNGGSSFPETEISEYSGQVSVLEGPNFSVIKPLITGLPVSNHDHGINGLTFDNQGDLYIAIGGNTNGGVPNSNIGGLPESPFTAAILKANITKANFNGQIEYVLPPDFQPPSGLTFDAADSQVFGGVAKVASGVDVSVYASGLRNPYDVVFTTKGMLYATDNGHNKGFGSLSTSATTEISASGAPDELNLVEQGSYYGHPNRNRGLEDNRQNIFYAPSQASIPGVYTAPLTTMSASTNGIVEYRATTFNNQLRGDLFAQQWNKQLYNFSLSSDGRQVQKVDSLTGVTDGLDIEVGPGGVIFGMDFAEDAITVATPNDSSIVGMKAFDIDRWRATATGGGQFIIGGVNFGSLADTTVTIGGQAATLTSVSTKRIMGILPSFSSPSNDLLDIEVYSNGQQSVIPDAFLALSGNTGLG